MARLNKLHKKLDEAFTKAKDKAWDERNRALYDAITACSYLLDSMVED